MSYPVHPNKEPPFPELSPCPWCGGENFRHDLTKHVNPALGTRLPCGPGRYGHIWSGYEGYCNCGRAHRASLGRIDFNDPCTTRPTTCPVLNK